ncbi:MAG: right-handed parallel beta-helix repeat-containing protein, partial [Bacteroidota bacterium]
MIFRYKNNRLFLSSLILLMLLGPLWLGAQTTGFAFLQGETNHQGIQAIFSPISVVGAQDTLLTDASGFYSGSIVPGVYKISFEKAGFNTTRYAAGQAQVITGTDTLQATTLSTLYYKYISGPILTDTLYADTVYIAVGDISVPGSRSLYFEPGTHLWFNGEHSFTVYGGFEAVGTPANPIYISADSTAGPPLRWENILIDSFADTIKIEYCDISYGGEGILVDGPAYAQIRNNRFHNSEVGLLMRGYSNSRIEENEFTAITGFCIILSGNEGTLHDVFCNYFHDAPATSIRMEQSESDVHIQANTCINMQGIYGGGLDVAVAKGDALVEDNAILNSSVGIKILIHDSLVSTVTVQNNLMAGNHTGLFLRGGDGGAVIQMNAIIDNIDFGVVQPYPPAGTPDVFTYNLVGNNPTDYLDLNIPGVGTIITTNVNGTPADAYLNIADPGSYDPQASLLPLGPTPLVNAGDPNAPLEQDGSIADIGINSAEYCFPAFAATSAPVFPGDADYNQSANVWDLLPIGQHFGTTGPSRANASILWQGQAMQDWGLTQANGEDLKHLDTDGNGIIHSADTAAIMLNYNATHNSISGKQSGGVPMYLGTPPSTMNPGDTITVPLYLGTFDSLAVDIYGMAFSIDYDSSM